MARHAVADANIRMTSFFGGSENQITSQQFRGGRIYVVFGSGDIDLRRATTADDGATINIITSFGGVKLLVVSHVWNRRDRGGEVCPWRPGC